MKTIVDSTIDFEDPNIVGRNVTITTHQYASGTRAGDVGYAAGYVEINLANGMTPEQRMAFAAAEREDLAYMGAPVSAVASFSTSNTITRTTGSWLTDGFKAGMRIEVSGSTYNNTAGADLYVIASVDATTITITTDSALKNEGAKTVTVTPEIMSPTVFTKVNLPMSAMPTRLRGQTARVGQTTASWRG